MNIVDVLVCAVSAATCARLMFYQRKGSTFKRGISAVAYAVIVITGALTLALLTGRITAASLHPAGVLLLCFIAALVFYARGNVAAIIRTGKTILSEVKS
mgnify:CR=1 FL=1|jgi:hypothetical protein